MRDRLLDDRLGGNRRRALRDRPRLLRVVIYYPAPAGHHRTKVSRFSSSVDGRDRVWSGACHYLGAVLCAVIFAHARPASVPSALRTPGSRTGRAPSASASGEGHPQVSVGAFPDERAADGPVAAPNSSGPWRPVGQYRLRISVPKAFSSCRADEAGVRRWRGCPSPPSARAKRAARRAGRNRRARGGSGRPRIHRSRRQASASRRRNG